MILLPSLPAFHRYWDDSRMGSTALRSFSCQALTFQVHQRPFEVVKPSVPIDGFEVEKYADELPKLDQLS